MVFGIISENMRISNVKIAEKMPTSVFPYTSMTREPTIAAPTVLAMVFTQRMADIGRSVFCFNDFNRLAPFTPWSSSPVIYESGVESNVASRTEHSAETAIEAIIHKYIACSSMMLI